MREPKTEAYAEMKITSSGAWYRIYISNPDYVAWHGPYRDKVDAENAAEDEADSRGLELVWRSW